MHTFLRPLLWEVEDPMKQPSCIGGKFELHLRGKRRLRSEEHLDCGREPYHPPSSHVHTPFEEQLQVSEACRRGFELL